MWTVLTVLICFFVHCVMVLSQFGDGVSEELNQPPQTKQFALSFGSCKFVFNPQCPDPDVTFFMYSQTHPDNPEQINVGTSLRMSNLKQTSFNPRRPTKFIIHGYNSDMLLNALTELRKEYLKNNECNVFTVDWSPLNKSPCYPAAVWNARHVGVCSAQLIQRIRDMGATDIHVIGFSLGAHIANYLAIAMRPYKLPRITGLDPAFPGFITPNRDEKLDKSDGEFVDVYHTNAFMQGKAEESGHVDFYFNGGIVQPGCWGSQTENFFSCNHHRAPLYYAESINSKRGFFGWPCSSYFDYLLGRCPPQDPQLQMGEYINKLSTGVYIIVTRSEPPFALGKLEGFNPNVKLNQKKISNRFDRYRSEVDFSGMDEASLINEMMSNQSLRVQIMGSMADNVFWSGDNFELL